MSSPARPGRAAFAFIFITVALDMLALGVIVPVLPKLILSFEQGDAGDAMLLFGVLGGTCALTQFASLPIVGVLVLSRVMLSIEDHHMAAAAHMVGVFGGTWALMQFL